MGDISHAHIVSLLYKLITSGKGSDDLSIGFDRGRGRRKDELTNNKNIKGNYHLRIMVEDVLGFAECQEKATHGLGYKLILTRNKDDAVGDKAVGFADARFKIDLIHSYVHITLHPFNNKVFCLNNFEVRHLHSSDMLNDLFLLEK